MSQNKTIIPDVDYNMLGTQSTQGGFSDFYSPSAQRGEGMNGTYVGAGAPSETMSEPSQSPQSSQNNAVPGRWVELQERVITGVLFSISKGLLGEIYPLYLGRNLVGSTPECDVRLNEASVSSVHALIQVYKDFETGAYDISVTDYASSHGTSVNGERGDFGSFPLKENDILTIGRHYRFIVKLFDAEKAGLYEDPEFEDVGGERKMPEPTAMSNDFYAPSQGIDSIRTVIY